MKTLIINDVSKLSVNLNSKLCYENQPIGKWWGKTLYHIDGNNLQCKNFTIFERFLQLFGINKEFNSKDLGIWIAGRIVNLKLPANKDETTEKVVVQGLKALKEKGRAFKELCKNIEKSKNKETEDAAIQMLKDGLDVNTVIDDCNTTLLEEACKNARFGIAKYLIEQGAEVNTMSKGGGLVYHTPLQHAISHGYDQLTLLLLERGADVNTKNGNGEPPLYMAIKALKKKPGAQSIFEETEPTNPQKIIQTLLNKGAEVNELDDNGCTPLYHACDAGNLEIVQLLIEKNADVNFGKPPLTAALYSDHWEIAKLLIEKGASTNPIGEKRWEATPLAIAAGAAHLYGVQNAWKPNHDIIRLLHARGGDINAQGGLGSTPLHIAIDRKDLETVQLLLELGADPSIKTAGGQTAFELAASKGLVDIQKALEQAPK